MGGQGGTETALRAALRSIPAAAVNEKQTLGVFTPFTILLVLSPSKASKEVKSSSVANFLAAILFLFQRATRR